MSTRQDAAFRHWLLRQERWLGRLSTRIAADPPRPEQARFQRKYGPDGDVFYTTAVADTLVGFLLMVPGALLAAIALGDGPLAAIGYWMLGIGLLSCALSFTRIIQGSRAGRAFRAGRPFIRRAPDAGRPGPENAAPGGYRAAYIGDKPLTFRRQALAVCREASP